jgi:hypothetical protein
MADVIDLAAHRARVAARPEAEPELTPEAEAQFLADWALEEGLPRDRLTGEALASLRRQLLPFAAGEHGDALMPVATLYALARELLYSRALLRCVVGAWESRKATPEMFENDLAAVVADVVLDEQQLETITDPEVVLAGTVELG